MASQSQVRLATKEDREEIFRLCKLLHSENGLFPMDDDLVQETMMKGINRNGGILGVIGPTGGPLEGMIYMLISNFWYSRKPHLEELFSYVPPEYRKSNHAKSLIEFAKKCATDDIRLVIGVVSNTRTEAKVRLYERRLGKPAGAFFVYPPPAAAYNG
jgi:Acetyltransferase (GNAT) family